MNRSSNIGFSLVELMVTVAIAAILLSLAAPSFRQIIASTTMTSQANEFVTMLGFARSEAVKRNTRVTLCKSATGAACVTSGTWAQGYMVFTDDLAAGTIGAVDIGEAVLRVHPALTGGSTLVGSADVAGAPAVPGVADFVSFSSNGQSTRSGRWDLCSVVTTLPGRDIVLSPGTGLPSVTKDNAPTCS